MAGILDGIIFVRGGGQRFADIARENGVSTRALLRANPQIERGKDGRYHAEAGQMLFLPQKPDANRAVRGSGLLTFDKAEMAAIDEAEARGKLVPGSQDLIIEMFAAGERRVAESERKAAAAAHEFNGTQRFVVGAKVTVPELRVNYRDTEGCWGQPEKNYDIYRNVPGTVAEVKQENGEFVYKVKIDEGVRVDYDRTRHGKIARSSEGDRGQARLDAISGGGLAGGLLGSLARKTGVGAGVGMVGGLIYTELVVGKVPIGGSFDLKATDLVAASEK